MGMELVPNGGIEEDEEGREEDSREQIDAFALLAVFEVPETKPPTR